MTKVVTSLQTSQEVAPKDTNGVTWRYTPSQPTQESKAHRARRWREIMTSLYGRLEIPNPVRLYQKFTEVPMISISTTQQQPLH
jgi:hypothetical protein